MVQNVSRWSLTVVGRFHPLANAICCEEKVALGRGFQPAFRFPCQRRPANVTLSFIYLSQTGCNLSS